MQTTIFTQTQAINPFAAEEAAQRAPIENLGSQSLESRFDRLPDAIKNQLNQWFIFSSNERELVSRIDRHFDGVEHTEEVNGHKYIWKGYSKIADIAVEEYRKRAMAHH
ncbi:MAG: hypothetical protein IE914_04290 [Thiotrichales bacterium]|nr:hypothetical protein [Thiotrichales bacterium]